MSLHSAIYTFVASLIALFPVLNPIGDSFIVHGYLHDLDDQQRKAASRRIFLNCLFTGLVSLLLGHLILLLFGLAVPVIQVGGGFIICKTGYDMLAPTDAGTVKAAPHETKKIDIDDIKAKLFYPISFPICFGPGCISVVFTMMATSQVKGDWLATGVNYGMIIAALVILLLVLYVLLLQGPRLMKKLGDSGNMIISKFIAFITFCVGIQIIIEGLAKIFSLTTTL